jgi:outer membrane protein assembly factor BamB
MKHPHLAIKAMLISASLLYCTLAMADDWPQWRGPNRDGISKETGLLKNWPENGPKLVWQVKDIGFGYSTPAVVGERLYLMSNEGAQDEFVRALNGADGTPVWSIRIGKVGPNIPAMNYPGARSTPTIDGDVMYALGSDGDVACLETATGNIRWQKNLRTDFGGKPGSWAYADSLLVDGESLICTPGGADATLVALSKKSGDVMWKSAIPGADEAGYSSAIAIEVEGIRQYVQFLQKGLVGIDAKTGKFLWRYERTAKNSPANIFTPVARDGLIYTGAARSGGGLIQVKKSADTFQAEEIYFNAKLPVAIGGAVLVGDYLYGTGGQVLICNEFKTGTVKWTNRSVGAGAILFADERLYLHGENGEVALVEATPDGYREHGRFEPPGSPDRGRSKAWAYPVVANGRLYIRDLGALWCYDVRDTAAAGK